VLKKNPNQQGRELQAVGKKEACGEKVLRGNCLQTYHKAIFIKAKTAAGIA